VPEGLGLEVQVHHDVGLALRGLVGEAVEGLATEVLDAFVFELRVAAREVLQRPRGGEDASQQALADQRVVRIQEIAQGRPAHGLHEADLDLAPVVGHALSPVAALPEPQIDPVTAALRSDARPARQRARAPAADLEAARPLDQAR
jgi:hypothetical protein